MIDFLKYRYVTAAVSLVIICGTAGMAIYRRVTRGQVFSYSIDFTEGNPKYLKFSKPVVSEDIRQIVEKAGWPGAIMREFGPQDVLVRVKEVATDPQGLAERIKIK